MKTKRFLSLAAIFALSFTFFACSSDTDPPPPVETSSSSEQGSLCAGKEYDPSVYRCESNELVGKCKGEDYYPAYQTCKNGVIQDKNETSSSSSNETSSSSSIGRLPCGTSDYNPLGQFCHNGTVYALCGGEDYNPTTQLCQSNVVTNGWRNLDGFTTPSNDAWTWSNDGGVTGSIIKSNLQGVEFSAVTGSSTEQADIWKLQLLQKNHSVRSGDCYYVKIQGRTTANTRKLNFGFQEDGGSYANYGSDDFIFNTTLGIISKYFYINRTDSRAVFYLNSGLNSSAILSISYLEIEKTSAGTQSDCESLND